MRGNIVIAAAVFGSALLLSSLLLLLGIGHVADRSVNRIEAAFRGHGEAIERAGDHAGVPIRASLDGVAAAFDRHARSVEHAGDAISHPAIPNNYDIKLQGPVTVQQPLLIRGPEREGALPVNARVGK